MAFDWQQTHYPTLSAFEAALTGPAPGWARGVVVHHTWKPTVSDWRGERTMIGMRDYYIGLGWSAGPQVYVAPDGIWIGTPLRHQGVHATWTNASHWGIEVVGDYDAAPWQGAIDSLARGAIVALLRWCGAAVTPTTLLGHRETGSDKSCPGRAIDMNALRRDITRRLATPTPVRRAPHWYVVPAGCVAVLRYTPRADGETNVGMYLHPSTRVHVAAWDGAWARVSAGGYIHQSGIESEG